MAAQTSKLSRIDPVAGKLKKYIDDGEMKRVILHSQTPLYEHMSFVDWNHQSSTCRILLAGLDPNGYTKIQRNVVSMQYNDSITSYFIRQKFPFVKTVYVILSDDVDFDEIVASKGGRIEYGIIPNMSVPAVRWMTHYGDQHPDIESTIKSAVPNNATISPFPMCPQISTPVFFKSYHLVWYLNPLSRVIGIDRTLIEGMNNIVANSHLLPDFLSLKKLHNECTGCEYAVTCRVSEFFKDDKYKLTIWN